MTPRTSIETERHQLGVADAEAVLIRLNRPEAGNALDVELLGELGAALTAADSDPVVRAVLLTGAGKVFVAGGDIKQARAIRADPLDFTTFITQFQRSLGRLREVSVPVIALVNGFTAAGGLELLLHCDIVLAARSATIRDGHLAVGQMGGGGMLSVLPRMVGLYRASEMVYTSRPLDAEEAERWGLVNRCVDDAALLGEGLAVAGQIAASSRLAIANAKAVMTEAWASRVPLPTALLLERERAAYYGQTSADAAEGMTAFAERRPPRFVGR